MPDVPAARDPTREALLVIDVQQAFLAGPHRAFDVERVIACINRLTERARAVGVPVLFVQHESASGPFARGSQGWELADGMRVEQGDRVVPKRASDAFHGSGLAEALQEFGVSRLVVCGMQAEYCVDSTVRRALALGFDVRLVEDAVTTLPTDWLPAERITAHHVRTLAGIQSYPGRASAWRSSEVFAA